MYNNFCYGSNIKIKEKIEIVYLDDDGMGEPHYNYLGRWQFCKEAKNVLSISMLLP